LCRPKHGLMLLETVNLSTFTAPELAILAEHLAYARDRLDQELQSCRLGQLSFREVCWLICRRNYFRLLTQIVVQGQPVVFQPALPHGPGFLTFLHSEASRTRAAIPKLAAVAEILPDWRLALNLEARFYRCLLDQLGTDRSPSTCPIPITPLLFVCLPESLLSKF
jgi:hypothetical protein